VAPIRKKETKIEAPSELTEEKVSNASHLSFLPTELKRGNRKVVA